MPQGDSTTEQYEGTLYVQKAGSSIRRTDNHDGGPRERYKVYSSLREQLSDAFPPVQQLREKFAEVGFPVTFEVQEDGLAVNIDLREVDYPGTIIADPETGEQKVRVETTTLNGTIVPIRGPVPDGLGPSDEVTFQLSFEQCDRVAVNLEPAE